MAPDDRDRTFEKALARHLRPSASSRPDTGPISGASAELCPDPELLAAYHDGSLSLEERNLWKQHVVGCESCQFVLAHLETALDVPVVAEASESAAALERQPAAAAVAPAPARSSRPSLIHSLRWLWLVPAGVVAATLIVWISLQERKPAVPSASSVEIAQNRPSGDVAPLAKTAPALPAESKKTPMENERKQPAAPSPAAAASAERDLASKTPQNQLQLSQELQNAPNLIPNHGPSVSAQKQEQQINRIAGATGVLDLKKLDTQNAPKPSPRVIGALAKAAPAPPPPPPVPSLPSSEPSFLADQSVSAAAKDKGSAAPQPAPAATSNGAAVAKTNPANADAISAVTETVEVTGASQMNTSNALATESGRMRVASLLNPRVFWAPGGKHAWRLGPAGSLEHSKDKGLTWTLQISGVYTDLVAASAPSAKVCWIVGTSGTILLTTDGGAHWTKLESPVSNDLTAIHATDAKHASISFAPDAQTGLVKTYQTSDAGLTWFSAPSDH
jgi:hypothetical protein